MMVSMAGKKGSKKDSPHFYRTRPGMAILLPG
jgi:hypothetical protein